MDVSSRVALNWETTLGPPPSWYAAAACHDRDLLVWFPTTRLMSKRAIAICESCPVRAECLEYALEHVELVGIWGGRTFRERIRIRAQRGQAQRSPDGAAVAIT